MRTKPNLKLVPNSPTVEELSVYKRLGITVIPLHAPFACRIVDGVKKPLGKIPLHTDWTRRRYSSAKVALKCEGRLNCGGRLPSSVLCVDVDPRNGGAESFAALTKLVGDEVGSGPGHLTGGGGTHHFFTKPGDWPIAKTLPQFPGIEFLSKGTQILLPGAVHPNGTRYEVDDLAPPLSEIADAPQALLDLIRKPDASQFDTAPGKHTTEQLATMLTGLPVKEFGTNAEWWPILCASHHATGGAGLAVFTEWSAGDPKFSGHSADIESRWNSLNLDGGNKITVATLFAELHKRGKGHLIPPDNAGADFPPAGADFPKEAVIAKVKALKAKTTKAGCTPEEAASAAAKVQGLMELYDISDEDLNSSTGAVNDDAPLWHLSRTYFGVTDGGRFRIYHLQRDPERPGQMLWMSLPKNDFINSLLNKPRVGGRGLLEGTRPLATTWLNWPLRKHAMGTTIDPSAPTGALVGGHSDSDGALNLWTGWGVEAAPGEWSKLRAMIKEVLCDNDETVFEYLLNWIAWKVQHPGEQNEVAIILIGGKGSGKTTLGKTMAEIFGSHGITVTTAEQLAGKFSGHMAQVCFIFADEAFDNDKNKAHMGTLKQLITDRDTSREAKGKDIVRAVNRASLMIAVNEGWTAPATIDDRRYLVLTPSTARTVPQPEKLNDPNRRYWDELYAELKGGGRAAFMQAMLERALPAEWHPRIGVPRTQGLADEIVKGAKGPMKFWLRLLQDKNFPVYDVRDYKDDNDYALAFDNELGHKWTTGPLRVAPHKLLQYYQDGPGWREWHEYGAEVTDRKLFETLHKFGVTRGRMDKSRYWVIPKFDVARAKYEEVVGGKVFEK